MIFMTNNLKPGSRPNLTFGCVSDLKERVLAVAFAALRYGAAVAVLGRDTGGASYAGCFL